MKTLLLLLLLPLFATAQSERQSVVLDKLNEATVRFNSLTQRLAEKDYPTEIKLLETWLADTGYNLDSVQDARLLPRLFADSAVMIVPAALLTDADRLALGVVGQTTGRIKFPLALVQTNQGKYRVTVGGQNIPIAAGQGREFTLKNFLGGSPNFLLTDMDVSGAAIYTDRRSAVERGRYAEILFYPRNQ